MDGQSWRELASCWQYCARHGHIKPTACHSEGRGRQPIAIRRRPEQNTEHMVTQVHTTRLTHRRSMCSPPHATPGAGRACCRRLQPGAVGAHRRTWECFVSWRCRQGQPAPRAAGCDSQACAARARRCRSRRPCQRTQPVRWHTSRCPIRRFRSPAPRRGLSVSKRA